MRSQRRPKARLIVVAKQNQIMTRRHAPSRFTLARAPQFCRLLHLPRREELLDLAMRGARATIGTEMRRQIVISRTHCGQGPRTLSSRVGFASGRLIMAYTMIAERNNQKVRKQRESALIVLANARVMQSEGWQVTIVDEDGSDFEPRAFEASLAKRFSWYQVQPEPVVAPSPAAEPTEEPIEAEALVAAALEAEELEAEELESAEFELHDVDEADFDDADLELAELHESDHEEAELDELEFEGEPAE
jgi:hypothetical protein